jgi:hypothetical protein
MVDQLRDNGYCKVEVKEGLLVGEGKRICDGISGG